MATMYLIGGAPRSGKSTIAHELVKQKPMLAVTKDAIRSVAKGVWTPAGNPRLFKTARGAFGSDHHLSLLQVNPQRALEYELGEADETWKSVLDFMSYYQQDGKDAAIEGVAVLPEQLAKQDFTYKAVFFVNLSDQTDIILAHAKSNRNDWLRKYNEHAIRLYAKFILLWNTYYADTARKLKLPVVEVDNDNFEASVGKAVKLLLS